MSIPRNSEEMEMILYFVQAHTSKHTKAPSNKRVNANRIIHPLKISRGRKIMAHEVDNISSDTKSVFTPKLDLSSGKQEEVEALAKEMLRSGRPFGVVTGMRERRSCMLYTILNGRVRQERSGLPLMSQHSSANIKTSVWCPMCGKSKARGKYSCKDCKKSYGERSNKAAKAVIKGFKEAETAHQRVQKEGVYRESKFRVLADIRLNNAEYRTIPGGGHYWAVKCFFKGGVIEVYVFGAKAHEVGGYVTAVVEPKTRQVRGRTVPYIRAEVVRGVRSDLELKIAQGPSGAAKLASNAPFEHVLFENKEYTIGFVPC
jgi:hypothetical protein